MRAESGPKLLAVWDCDFRSVRKNKPKTGKVTRTFVMGAVDRDTGNTGDLRNRITFFFSQYINVSGYTCNHGSLRIGNETLRPLEGAMGTPSE